MYLHFLHRVILVFCLSCCVSSLVAQTDCENDTTAPTPYCLVGVEVELSNLFGTYRLSYTEINSSSFDDCTQQRDLRFYLTKTDLSEPPTSEQPEIMLEHTDAGQLTIYLWVGDTAGNWDKCVTAINVISNCENDDRIPSAICNAELTVDANNSGVATISVEDINDVSSDNCGAVTLAIALQGTASGDNPPTAQQLDLSPGNHVVELWVTDQSGNYNICWTFVEVTGDCASFDTNPPTIECASGLSLDFGDSSRVNLLPEALYTHATDNCTSQEDLLFRIEKGEGSETVPTTTELTFTIAESGRQFVTLWVGDTAGNWKTCTSYLLLGDTEDAYVFTGKTYNDTNQDCTFGTDENAVRIQKVRAFFNDRLYTSTVAEDGTYTIKIPKSLTPEGQPIWITPIVEPHFERVTCLESVFYVSEFLPDTNIYNVPILLYFDCPTLNIDVHSPELLDCAINEYWITYGNVGLETATNPVINLTVDPYQTIVSATEQYVDNGNGNYSFFLDDILGAAQYGLILEMEVSCDAPTGYAHRVEATITADNTCEELNPNWNGASIKVTGECDEDNEQVRLQIRNVGDTDMDEPMQYIIVEDVILLQERAFELPAGQAININVPADGTTWRLEAEQVDFHPGQSMPSVTVEGCGGVNFTGLPLVFSHDDRDLNKSISYQQTVTTDDTEVFVGYPKGYSEAHFIEPNTPVEYLVRFLQPTDDEEIIVEVQIPKSLNIEQLRTGATNGNYEFVLKENTVQFIFSEFSEGEMGFIKFNVPQKTNLPLGTRIETAVNVINTDAELLVTADYFHTVQTDFVQLSTNTTDFTNTAIDLQVFPNPATDQLTIIATGDILDAATFELLDVNGKVVQRHIVQHNQVQIPSLKLATGMYFFQLQQNGALLQRGKLMVK